MYIHTYTHIHEHTKTETNIHKQSPPLQTSAITKQETHHKHKHIQYKHNTTHHITTSNTSKTHYENCTQAYKQQHLSSQSRCCLILSGSGSCVLSSLVCLFSSLLSGIIFHLYPCLIVAAAAASASLVSLLAPNICLVLRTRSVFCLLSSSQCLFILFVPCLL